MPSHDDDISLESTAPISAGPQDAARPQDAGDFSMTDFVNGHRSTRGAVLIPEKASLLGEIEKLDYRISHAPDDANVDDLIERFQELVEEYKDAQRFWTFEARSPEWIDHRHAEFAKAQRIKLDRNKNPTTERDAVLVVSDQMVGQVVEVEPLHGGETVHSVTLEQLIKLYDENAALWNLLQLTMNRVNTQVPQADTVLTRDFSQRSSTGRSGTAS